MKPLSFIIIFLLITGILIGSPAQGVSTVETKKLDPDYYAFFTYSLFHGRVIPWHE